VSERITGVDLVVGMQVMPRNSRWGVFSEVVAEMVMVYRDVVFDLSSYWVYL
jgi:hypothetical protein